jgi:hypothetical protein
MSLQVSAATRLPIQPVATPRAIHLSDEQLRALHSCSNGVSLRFEEWATVNALLLAGFVEKNPAGVIRVTSEGREYLRRRAV